MDIIINQSGLIKKENQEIDESLLILELPLKFKGINSGPDGITNASIRKFVCEDITLRPTCTTTIFSYKNNSAGSICGEQLIDTVHFSNTDGDNSNTLVFKTCFDESDNVISNKLTDSFGEIYIKIFFKDSQALDIIVPCKLTNENTGELNCKNPIREHKNYQTKINLFLLIAIIGGLAFWNYWMNKDIYLQEENVYSSREILTGIIGFLVAFFGLSIKKIKSVFTVFTDAVAFFRFPELHLSLEQFNGFSSKFWTAAVMVVALLSGYIIYANWFINLDVDKDLQVYDKAKRELVNTEKYKKIFTKHLKDKNGENRFELQLKSTNDSTRFSAIKVGEINAVRRKTELHQFNIIYKSLSRNSETSNYALELLKPNAIEGITIPFKDIFTLKKVSFPEDLYVDYQDLSSRIITISDKRQVDKTEILNLIKGFKTRIDEQPYLKTDDINQDRLILTKQLKNEFASLFGSNAVIDHDIILNITHSLIKETSFGGDVEKKSIERYIILTAIWQATEERLSRGFNFKNEHLKTICESIKKTLRHNNSWKRDRSIMAFIIEMRKQVIDRDAYAIEFIHENMITGSGRHLNMLDFLVVTAITDTYNDLYVKAYIDKDLPRIRRKYVDENSKFSEAIIKQENTKDLRGKDFVGKNEDLKSYFLKFNIINATS
jgi:hypothetical protein